MLNLSPISYTHKKCRDKINNITIKKMDDHTTFRVDVDLKDKDAKYPYYNNRLKTQIAKLLLLISRKK